MRDIRRTLFQYRSYTPIPFLIAMLMFAEPTTKTLLIGFIVAALGEALRLWGVAYAGRLTRVTGNVGAPAVVITGPYAHVRNPLYLGNILLYVGIGIMSNALMPWFLIVALMFFFWQYFTIVSLEEEFLEKEFGTGYLEYKNHVPRFIPQLRRYKSLATHDQPPNWDAALHSEKRTFQALALVMIALVAVRWYRG